MSDVSRKSILSVFPSALADKQKLAEVVANELISLYNDNDLLRIYTRIDELDEALLDILAYDFKIDWWDENLTLAEKRRTVKDHFAVHRSLGTVGAVERAVSAIYATKVSQWHDYGGAPYHYKLVADTAGEMPDNGKFSAIIDKREYYENLRSVLDAVTFVVKRSTPKMYAGAALRLARTASYKISGIDVDKYVWLSDADGDMLLDGNASPILNP